MAPSFDADDEASLLRRARATSAEERGAAQHRVFELFRERVFALCLHILGNRADAQDAVQDTFVSVFGALERFRGESRLSTWIYRITLREALRHKSRRRQSESIDDAMPAPDGGDPAIRREQREQRERLSRALDRLSAEHRTVLSLFAIDGLSHREIADVLGVPEGTIWSRLHGARKRLAAELAS
jgi:RNA polymerase sigma-70 factor, ECF subfamily